MDASKKAEYQKILMSLVPESGGNIGNVTLRERLRQKIESLGDQLSEEDYWLLRNPLIDEGQLEQGRGRGGSVHRVSLPPVSVSGVAVADAFPSMADAVATELGPPPAPTETPAEAAEEKAEASLYEPFHKAIVNGYTKDNRLKEFISEITAHQGRRATGGKWTRPDVTLVAVKTYQFTPGKRLEVVTFEVKPYLDSAFEGIYEALAHSAFAHRSYLAVDIREHKDADEISDERIVEECTRHGVGYITFTDVADYDTYEIVCPAVLKEPDPEEVDSFIKVQINRENQEQLHEFLR